MVCARGISALFMSCECSRAQSTCIVVLVDESTDQDAARDAVGAPSARFIWHDVARLGRGGADSVLQLLLEGAPATPPGSALTTPGNRWG